MDAGFKSELKSVLFGLTILAIMLGFILAEWGIEFGAVLFLLGTVVMFAWVLYGVWLALGLLADRVERMFVDKRLG